LYIGFIEHKIVGKDRETLVRHLAGQKADATRGKVKLYKIATAVAVLIANASAGSGGTPADTANAKAFASERTKKLRAQREAIERENAIKDGEWVEVEKVGGEVERCFSIARENLLGIAGAISDEVARSTRGAANHEVARLIAHDLFRDKLYEVLDVLASPANAVDKIIAEQTRGDKR
jgi:hypothetical protein